ncbi:tyrosine-type recombinase/integrase [Muricoccus roseus]|uniref:tyrosine-type recombinase/integrase n=1 Tax=Muricoccus roseus TaxID=198092 RepID=UPI0009335ADE|nr:tyrosine-type recombinase/integrase [Roseomonas rosea]
MASSDDNQRPQHVKQVKGRWYWDPPDRLRKSHGLKTVALGGDTPNAWAAARSLNKEHLALAAEAPLPGSVAWLLGTFNETDRFNGLAASTQKDYRHLARVLGGVEVGNTTLGRMAAMSIRPRHADGLFAKLKAERGLHTAHYACRYARRVWKWAARKELVGPVNPWAGMELPTLPARKTLWTKKQVDAVVAGAYEQQRPSLALATLLAYWLGHREGDVLSLTWEALGETHRETSKTGAQLPVVLSAYPELVEAIAAAPRGKVHVVEREGTCTAYNEHTFRHEWRAIADLAGIPKTHQFRDLRATALTELSDSGADILHMRTHGGHKTAAMAARYARPTAEQFKRAAADRMAAREAAEQGNRPGSRETDVPAKPVSARKS